MGVSPYPFGEDQVNAGRNFHDSLRSPLQLGSIVTGSTSCLGNPSTGDKHANCFDGRTQEIAAMLRLACSPRICQGMFSVDQMWTK